MLPIVRPQRPARVRVGWPPFAGISFPGAEALRLLIMDYEQRTPSSLLRMCRPHRGQPRAYTPIEPQCHDAAMPTFVLLCAQSPRAPQIGAKPGDGQQPKGRELTATITPGMR